MTILRRAGLAVLCWLLWLAAVCYEWNARMQDRMESPSQDRAHMASLTTLTVDVRLSPGGKPVPARWRLRLLALTARLLGVPLHAEATSQ